MQRYHDLDPFNHGTASIEYEKIADNEFYRLANILKCGWGREPARILRRSAGAEKNSNNFRVETESRAYLLKHSHINNPRLQEVINRAIAYLKDSGIKTPTIIPTIKKITFYASPEGVFCLYEFIEGENYDGSQEELRNVASELARLHIALAAIPFGR